MFTAWTPGPDPLAGRAPESVIPRPSFTGREHGRQTGCVPSPSRASRFPPVEVGQVSVRDPCFRNALDSLPMSTSQTPATRPPARDMVWIPGGTFRMGSADFYPEERPVHDVTVDGFWMDDHPVTVAEFRRFVKATGHVTLAEQPPDPADYPGADPALLVPGSLVFQRTPGPVDLDDYTNWWAWVPGAQWRHPEGQGSTLDGRERHPVTHVAYEDAVAYADLGRQGAADRGRMGVRRARRPRRRDLRVGRRVRAEGSPDGEHLAGRVPLAEPAAGQVRAARRRSEPSRRTATACTTWPATSGNGRATTTRRRHPDAVVHACCGPGGPRVNPRASRPTRATTWAGQASDSRGWSSRAARTCARPNYCHRYRPAARSAADGRNLDGPPRLPLHRPTRRGRALANSPGTGDTQRLRPDDD